MKKIIVTGGSGFIGSNLIKYLLKNKYFVINIDKLSYSANPYNLKDLINNKNYFFLKSDLNNRKRIIKILNKYKPDGIFNLAAETHVDRSIDDPKKFINSNILGVYNLLESILIYIKKNKKKIKLIHVSTDEVYGDLIKGRSSETFPYKPSSPYAASKASADHLIKAYVRTYKIPAIISNCCNNYGPNQFPEKLLPKLIFNIINNKSLPIYGKGKNSREWIHVDDHCRALLLIFLEGKIGENYNVGSGQNVKNIDITKKLLKLVRKRNFKMGSKVKIKFVKDRPGHDFRYALNNSKIKKELKWRSGISLNSGLSRTFEWYLNNYDFFKKVSKELFDVRLGLKR
jgi:dTDP-glucose 4,6-dehydratase